MGVLQPSHDENVGALGTGGYVPALDGVRALAVLAVLAFHAGFPAASGGYLGVSLFFTLSGFLMGAILLRPARATGAGILHFWERRFRRLLPAAVVTLGGVAVLARHFGDGTAAPGLRGDVGSALAYSANWRFLAEDRSYASLFAAPSPVQHFWSLSIEEQFYLVFPLLVVGLCVLARRRLAVVGAVLGGLFVASVATQLAVDGYDRAYYGTDTRAGELLAGALLACLVIARGQPVGNRRVASPTGLFALAGFVALVLFAPAHADWIVHGGLGAIALVSAVLVNSALVEGSAVNALLRFPPLVAVGRVSYGLYLYHWPIFLWVDGLATQLTITVLITVASYHLLECPIRYGRVLAHRPRFVGVVALGSAAAIALVAVAPEPTPVTALFDTSVFTPTPDAGANAMPVAHQEQAPTRVMVVGDSTGSPVAEGLSSRSEMEVLDATRPGCPLLRATTVTPLAGGEPRDVTSCITAVPQWAWQAREFEPDIVLVFSTLEDANVAFEQATPRRHDLLELQKELASQYAYVAFALRGTGAVVAWADNPYFSVGGQSDLQHELLDGRIDGLNLAATEMAAATPGAVLLDYARHLNAPDRTIDLAVRPDGVHLSAESARAAARGWLATAVTQALEQGSFELGTDDPTADAPLRVLVVGDSTSLALAAGLANHAREHGDLTVDWAGRVGCPLLDVERFRMFSPDPLPTGCTPTVEHWSERIAQFRPDVVLVFSSFMDSMDVDIGGVGWRHVGESDYDTRFAAQADALASAVAAGGAVMVWSDAPRPLTQGSQGFLATRFAALNELIAQADARWPHIVTLPLAAYIEHAGRAGDAAARPDGIHFTVEAATLIAEDWLSAELIARADQAATAAPAPS